MFVTHQFIFMYNFVNCLLTMSSACSKYNMTVVELEFMSDLMTLQPSDLNAKVLKCQVQASLAVKELRCLHHGSVGPRVFHQSC